MSELPPLLQPTEIHDLKLRNRVALAPMTRARSGPDRIPNGLMAEYYAQRSSAGLVITEATTISEQANGWVDSPGIYTDEMVGGWKKITSAVHEKGGTIFLQLWHTGRASHSDFHGGQPIVAPSAIRLEGDGVHTPEGKKNHEIPRALETDEIAGIVEDYRKAAERAKEAGFDGVEVHSANGYLLDEFLQSKTNKRTDRYGGSIEDRYRILDEVVTAVTLEYPANRVGVRLGPNGNFNDMGSSDFREQFSYVASQLNRYGLAYLHVMDGLAFGFHELGEPMTLQDFREVFDGPLMGNCGYDFETSKKVVDDGLADMVAIGRPYISNPDLVERWAAGAELNPDSDMADWYTPGGAKGYTDFPFMGY
ncbi:MAG: alkene reductase [Akkermansiaceae bacterium]